MIRVLQSVSNMARAGIETMLMNYYRHIDRDLIQFDFLANKPIPGEYDEEIRSMGGRVFVSPGLNPIHFREYERFVAQIVAQTPELKIVHGHNEAMAYYALQSAKKAGIGIRIAHAHNTQIIRDYKYPLKMVCKKLLPSAATDFWACGTDAGRYFFGQKIWDGQGHILHNAIDLDRFRFNCDIRAAVRRENGLDDCFLIGHVGRFNVQKNHLRLIDIFSKTAAVEPSARLALIGVGELEQDVRRKAAGLGIADKVLFLGQMERVDSWYQAMDCFVLPSLFEGLPVVGIEAQAAGLPCVFSDQVTEEAVLTPQTQRLSLQDSDEKWASGILSLRGERDRSAGESAVRSAGYDIVQEAGKLQEHYLKMVESCV